MSESRNDTETLARAFAARHPSRAALTQCPEPDLLFEAASGTLDRGQRLNIVDHVSLCPACCEAWRLAMELDTRPIGNVARATPAMRITVSIPRFALAASVIIAVGIATYISVPLLEQRPQYRQVSNPLAPSLLTAGKLPRDRFLLQWSPGPQGSTYTLRLSTNDLAPLLFKDDLKTAEFLVPGTAFTNVASGERLLWQVEVHLRSGERIASDTHTVTLK